jgi:hypothetical protein
MGTSTTTVPGEDRLKINGSVEAEATIWKDINPMALVVARSIQNGDLVHVRSFRYLASRPGIGMTLTSPAWTKYPVTSKFFLSGEILT